MRNGPIWGRKGRALRALGVAALMVTLLLTVSRYRVFPIQLVRAAEIGFETGETTVLANLRVERNILPMPFEGRIVVSANRNDLLLTTMEYTWRRGWRPYISRAVDLTVGEGVHGIVAYDDTPMDGSLWYLCAGKVDHPEACQVELRLSISRFSFEKHQLEWREYVIPDVAVQDGYFFRLENVPDEAVGEVFDVVQERDWRKAEVVVTAKDAQGEALAEEPFFYKETVLYWNSFVPQNAMEQEEEP